MSFSLLNGDLVSQYSKIFGSASAFSQGWIRKHQISGTPIITVYKSVRGLDEDRPRNFLQTFLADESTEEAGGALLQISSTSLDIAKPIIYDISPSGAATVSLHNNFYGTNGKEEKCTIEVQTDSDVSSETYRIDVSDLHGKVAGDSWFGGCSWSADERYFAYVASLKEEKPQTFFTSHQQQSTTVNPTDLKGKGVGIGDGVGVKSSKFRYMDDWGEKFTGVERLGIFVLDLQERRVFHATAGVDADAWTVGQPCFLLCRGKEQTVGSLNSGNNAGEDGSNAPSPFPINSLIYTAWKCSPRKLGMIYCYQRPSSLFAIDVSAAMATASMPTAGPVLGTSTAASSVTELPPPRHVLLTANIHTARSARCSYGSVENGASEASGSQGTVVFLGSRKGFSSHNGCVELFAIDVPSILEVVRAVSANEASFDGVPTLSQDKVRTVVHEVSDPFTHRINGEQVLLCQGASPLSPTDQQQQAGAGDVTSATAGLPFPGLFCDQLPRSCFSEDGNSLLLGSQWGSGSVVLRVSLSSGALSVVNVAAAAGLESVGGAGGDGVVRGSSSVLAVEGTSALCVYSTPTSPPVLALIPCTAAKDETSAARGRCSSYVLRQTTKHGVQIQRNGVKRNCMSSSSSNATSSGDDHGALELSDLQWHVFQHTKDGIAFESILIYPASALASASTTTSTDSNGGLPLVLVPHGGPHSCTSTSFVPSYAFLSAQLRAAVLHVNYRGSTGFGQRSIQSLLGNIGSNDVSDMMQCLEHAKSLRVDLAGQLTSTGSSADSISSLVDGGRVSVVGGSHGGFLTGHLIGQFPEVFKAACMRNPVTNVASMATVSDIPGLS